MGSKYCTSKLFWVFEQCAGVDAWDNNRKNGFGVEHEIFMRGGKCNFVETCFLLVFPAFLINAIVLNCYVKVPFLS